MSDRFAQDRLDRVVVRLLDRRDALIGMTAEAGEDLADLLGVDERFRRLRLHELDEREPVRSGDHERVVGVPHDPREFGAQDLVEDRVDVLDVDDGVHGRSPYPVHCHLAQPHDDAPHRSLASSLPDERGLAGRPQELLDEDRRGGAGGDLVEQVLVLPAVRGDDEARHREIAVRLQARMHRVVGRAGRPAEIEQFGDGLRRERAWRASVARRRRTPVGRRRRRGAAGPRPR